MDPVVVVLIVVVILWIGTSVRLTGENRDWRERFEHAVRKADQLQMVVTRETAHHEFWRCRSRERYDEYLAERKAHEMTRAEHVTLLKNLTPAYLWKDGGIKEVRVLDQPGDDDTPSVAEADRMAMEERRQQLRRQERKIEERERALREEGRVPLVIEDSEVEPPHRLDATAYDETTETEDASDDEGEPEYRGD